MSLLRRRLLRATDLVDGLVLAVSVAMLPALTLNAVNGREDGIQAQLVILTLTTRAVGFAAGAVLGVAAGLLLADGEIGSTGRGRGRNRIGEALEVILVTSSLLA